MKTIPTTLKSGVTLFQLLMAIALILGLVIFFIPMIVGEEDGPITEKSVIPKVQMGFNPEALRYQP